jgi:predicted DCC family thiol-disulfide oxidoreductase YuxK
MAEFPLNHDTCQQPKTYVKLEAAITVFELLVMSGVSLETCRAIKKHWNNKFYYTVASCWLFLYD